MIRNTNETETRHEFLNEIKSEMNKFRSSAKTKILEFTSKLKQRTQELLKLQKNHEKHTLQ